MKQCFITARTKGRAQRLELCHIAMAPHNRSICPICKLNIVDRTKHFEPILKQLCKSSGERKCRFFKSCSACFIHYIGDCCFGVLKKHIQFPDAFYPKLKNHERNLLFLSNHYPSVNRKRERLTHQSGGFLSILLPALVSSLFGLVTNLISRRTK